MEESFFLSVSFFFFFKCTYLYIVSVEEPSLSKLELFDAELQSVEVKLSNYGLSNNKRSSVVCNSEFHALIGDHQMTI